MDWLARQLDELAHDGLKRERRAFTPLPNGRAEWQGRCFRNFATNDYLNLASDPRVIAAATEALAEGVGAKASALVTGRTEWHERLEQRLADFEGTEAALLFPSGYAANVGTIAALIEPTDVVHCDRWNHASLIDGCRLSGARLRIYRHDDLDGLRRELGKVSSEQRQWIVTDSVFSMDGDLAPLSELCDLAEHYGATLIVDEAHGTGVFGERGRGVAEVTQTEQRIGVRIGTLSKALGTLGGFVSGSRSLIDWLWNRARSQVFSTALPSSLCAAAVAALDIVQTEPERRTHLHALCQNLRSELRSRGIEPIAASVGPIVPIIIGDPNRTMSVARQIEDSGFLIGAIRPPTVPNGTSRLRLSVTAAFSESDTEDLAAVIATSFNSNLV